MRAYNTELKTFPGVIWASTLYRSYKPMETFTVAGGAYIAQLWLFWLAPILGAAIAGVVSRWQHDLPDAK